MKDAGLNNTTLRRQNRGLVLKLIATEECSSRIEVSKKTGLSKMAATHIISEFLEEGIIEERESLPVKGKGRNPIRLCLSESAPKMIGVHIFRDECSVVLCDLKLHVKMRRKFAVTKESCGRIWEQLYECIDAVLQSAGEERLYGIGIGSLGPVDVGRGRILNPPNFYGKRDIEIVSMLKERYKLPVFFDSQYNCAALAEKYYGNGRDAEDFLFVGISNGIGSGVVTGGEINRDFCGFTSELGHVSIDWNGKLCTCGRRGCLEMYAGSRVITTHLTEITGKSYDFRGFCEMAKEEGDSLMHQVFADMVDKLACGITNAVNLYNPQKVLIGHEGYWLPGRYLDKLQEQVNRRKLLGDYHEVKVERPAFGENSHIVGCACSLLEKIFDGSYEYVSGPCRYEQIILAAR